MGTDPAGSAALRDSWTLRAAHAAAAGAGNLEAVALAAVSHGPGGPSGPQRSGRWSRDCDHPAVKNIADRAERQPQYYATLVEAWAQHLRAVASAALEPEPQRPHRRAAITFRPYPWIPARRLRRQRGPCTTGGDLRSPVAYPSPLAKKLIAPRGLALWGLTIAEVPDGITRALSECDDYQGTYGPFTPSGADVVIAVTAAVLARRGPDVLHIGLRLAASNQWGLAEICAVAEELAPTSS